MAPPYVDEDANEAAVEQGLAAAEAELRDTVADAYQEAAKQSEYPDETTDDIDFSEGEGGNGVPELSAIRDERIPDEEK